MTLQQLAYFVAVADVRSFTRAAESLGVAQPTLSRQLRALEDELGAPLVDRGGRDGPVLTPAGEAVLPLARRMLADSESARTAVAEIVGLRSGRVRVGATPSLCIGVLADVLRVFHDKYPDIRLELVEGGSQPLVRSLVRGELDVALVIVPPAGIDPALHTTPVLRERLSVASPTSDRSPSSRGSMTVRELARRPLVVPRQGYDVREATLQAYADAGETPRFAVEGGEMDAVLRLVEAGTGVAVVPDLVFAGRPRLRRTMLTPPLYRTVALARRADLTPTHAVRAFRDTLLSFLSVLSAGDGFPGDVQVLRRPDT
ncbi:LysR substrate-binding domain-containing protein [Pseudonocardia sp.]|uniref:LysR family transcriptional regulator n=1 Tax=Pseudonocardia sp. TaxID=60912 RepID=UPI002D9B631C|nr:LysR substrate-binding domain-containing protein [Pseudonocardia sp.]